MRWRVESANIKVRICRSCEIAEKLKRRRRRATLIVVTILLVAAYYRVWFKGSSITSPSAVSQPSRSSTPATSTDNDTRSTATSVLSAPGDSTGTAPTSERFSTKENSSTPTDAPSAAAPNSIAPSLPAAASTSAPGPGLAQPPLNSMPPPRQAIPVPNLPALPSTTRHSLSPNQNREPVQRPRGKDG